MATKNKHEQILWDMYRELYKNSTPSADFDELVKNATINERGEKVIDFMAYSITQEQLDEIIDSELKKHRLAKWEKQMLKTSCYLGCSPKSV